MHSTVGAYEYILSVAVDILNAGPVLALAFGLGGREVVSQALRNLKQQR